MRSPMPVGISTTLVCFMSRTLVFVHWPWRAKNARQAAVRRSILRGFFDLVDHHDVGGSLGGFELEADLFLDRRVECGRRIGCVGRRRKVGRSAAELGVVGGPIQREVEAAGK